MHSGAWLQHYVNVILFSIQSYFHVAQMVKIKYSCKTVRMLLIFVFQKREFMCLRISYFDHLYNIRIRY